MITGRSFLFMCSLLCFGFLHAQSEKNKDSLWNADTIIRLCSARYPKAAEEHHISGFDMDSNCAYVNFKILQSLGYGCDEEAIKAIRDCRVIHRGGNTRNCRTVYNITQKITFVAAEQ